MVLTVSSWKRILWKLVLPHWCVFVILLFWDSHTNVSLLLFFIRLKFLGNFIYFLHIRWLKPFRCIFSFSLRCLFDNSSLPNSSVLIFSLMIIRLLIYCKFLKFCYANMLRRLIRLIWAFITTRLSLHICRPRSCWSLTRRDFKWG